ncbi:XRE family transcriptional regulator [Neisseria sp. Ec49-e6-T10]|uniref:XRE family transcriptional regulator n=1 Tax=Neisseria sp. Ec49-e6-T10 TaxID=3140744 RepID=UPI003EBE0753
MEAINLSEWVKAARAHKNLTQEELAFEAGFSSKTSISAIERGVNQPTFETVLKIADVCSFPLPYQNIMSVETSESIDDIIPLPLYRGVHTSLILNSKGMNMDKSIQKFYTPTSILKNASVLKENAICILHEGNSMHPIIPDDSVTFIDTSSTNIIEGKLYAISYNGLLRIRRLYCLSNNLIKVNSYNVEEYPDELIEAEKLYVIGKVFGWFVQTK